MSFQFGDHFSHEVRIQIMTLASACINSSWQHADLEERQILRHTYEMVHGVAAYEMYLEEVVTNLIHQSRIPGCNPPDLEKTYRKNFQEVAMYIIQ